MHETLRNQAQTRGPLISGPHTRASLFFSKFVIKGRTPFFEKKIGWMIHCLLWLIMRYLLAQNPATTLVGERSRYKMFSFKKSFSTHFHLKIFNKHPYNIKKTLIHQPKKHKTIQKHQIKQSKNFLSWSRSVFSGNIGTQNNHYQASLVKRIPST